MSGVGGNKRQLPSWMLGVTKTEQTEKPSKRKNGKIPSLETQNVVPKVLKPRRIPLARNLEKEVDSALKVGSNVLVKCRTRKRKTVSERLDLDDEDDEVVGEDKVVIDDDIGVRKTRSKKRVDEVGSEIQLSTTSKKRNRKATEMGDRDECLVSSPCEEDEELTVEDLMTIAQEYVKADEGNECQQLVAKSSEPTELPVSFGFSRNDPGGSIEANQSKKDFMKERPTSTFNKNNRFEISRNDPGGSIEANQSSKNLTVSMKERPTSTFDKNNRESSEDGVIISSQSRTGDSTQDMLDLFLGPLLKIPQNVEKKYESVKEDVNMACEFRKQKQSEVLGAEVVPLTKKKSSLKDKVSLFFD
ncbi:hypothetical protein MKW94_024678 [Papaver nudicaule]|uniref:Uncharacterized protein n=1 Tax=Papaver nudicaule TaxID=74823 RepID=A0AA41VXP2_PAPNU|nr:hypothetical protein [Papaver nudicaule]